MAPSISATKTRPARSQLMAPIMARLRVTAGLNSPVKIQTSVTSSRFVLGQVHHQPPLIRKKTQTLTAKLNPKASEIYSNTGIFGTPGSDPSGLTAAPAAAVLATCVAVNAKNRNMNVPMNSPTMATKWLRNLFGKKPMPGTRSSFLFGSEGVPRRFMKGSCMKFEDGLPHELILAVLVIGWSLQIRIARQEERRLRCIDVGAVIFLSCTEEGSVDLSHRAWRW